MKMRVLAGDIGGTKVNLALCDVICATAGFEVRVVEDSKRRFASGDYKSIGEVLRAYCDQVAGASEIAAGCFGVPGPVRGDRIITVNLPWKIDHQLVREALGGKPAQIVNDLEAAALGLSVLKPNHGYVAISRDRTATAPIHFPQQSCALIAPGTGLGESVLYWNGTAHFASASEGGHSDFGPQSEEQIELLRWLWPRHKHVSFEHVASGSAVHRLYRFLVETGRETESPELKELFAKPGFDPSPVICERAIAQHKGAQTPDICIRVLDLWLWCLGAEASNLALKSLSYGGIFLGGGVPQKILPLFERAAFFDGFEAKGRMTAVVKEIPVYVVADGYCGLYGAALTAFRLGQTQIGK